VGHQDRRHPVPARPAHHAHHGLAAERVQRAGGLVGQQQPSLARHRAGHRDPLALAAGKLGRVAVRAVAEVQFAERAQGRQQCLPATHAIELKRQRNVFRGGQPGQQVEVLEHVADVPAAQAGPLALRQAVDRNAVKQHVAGRRLLQAAGDGQQARLARSAGAHDRHHRARRYGQVHVAERLDASRAGAVSLGHMPHLEHLLSSVVSAPADHGSAGAGIHAMDRGRAGEYG